MRVALVYGGPSPEYDVSLRSAETVRKVLCSLGHEVIGFHIPKDGSMPKEIFTSPVDIFYPVMHGRLGEDGCIQGLFECLDRPYVSETVTTSATGMDKALQLAIFAQSGIPVPQTVAVERGGTAPDDLMESDMYIVKMNSGGSSIGVYKSTKEDLQSNLEKVFALDSLALIQPFIRSLRELECLVVKDNRDGNIHVSGPVEVLAQKPYWVYENKYSSSTRCIRPDLDISLLERIRALATSAFRSVHGSLYMRVDFFLSGDDLMINEINTIPGSTETSHIIPLSEDFGGMEGLVQLLIDSAIARKEGGHA